MVDFLRLEFEIKKSGRTLAEYLEIIGIKKGAYYKRKAGETDFTLAQIEKTISVFGRDAAMEIFFSQKV